MKRFRGGNKGRQKGGQKEANSLSLVLSPDTRVDCSKLDFNYSREMTLDPLRSGHIREREEEKRMTAEGRKESETKDEEMMQKR